MTDDNRHEAGFGGVPVHRLLAPRVRDLACEVVAHLVREMPTYARLPPEELRGDIARVAERAIRAFIQLLRDGGRPDPGFVDLVRESAVRRAEEGVPLEAVVDAYFLGARACVDAVTPSAGPDDLGSVLTVQQLLMDYLRVVTAAVASGYFEGRRAALGEEREARQVLMRALLEGAPSTDAARRAVSPCRPATSC